MGVRNDCSLGARSRVGRVCRVLLLVRGNDARDQSEPDSATAANQWPGIQRSAPSWPESGSRKQEKDAGKEKSCRP